MNGYTISPSGIKQFQLEKYVHAPFFKVSLYFHETPNDIRDLNQCHIVSKWYQDVNR